MSKVNFQNTWGPIICFAMLIGIVVYVYTLNKSRYRQKIERCEQMCVATDGEIMFATYDKCVCSRGKALYNPLATVERCP